MCQTFIFSFLVLRWLYSQITPTICLSNSRLINSILVTILSVWTLTVSQHKRLLASVLIRDCLHNLLLFVSSYLAFIFIIIAQGTCLSSCHHVNKVHWLCTFSVHFIRPHLMSQTLQYSPLGSNQGKHKPSLYESVCATHNYNHLTGCPLPWRYYIMTGYSVFYCDKTDQTCKTYKS